MRDLMVLLIVCVAGVYFFWDGFAVPRVTGQAAVSAQSAEAGQPEADAKASSTARRAVRAEPAEEAAEDFQPAVGIPSAQLSRSEQPAGAAGFARPEQLELEVGMPMSQVVEILGAPDLKTATIDDGSLLENLIYTTPTRGEFTRIRFRGGRVADQ